MTSERERVRVDASAVHVYRRGRRVATSAGMSIAYLLGCVGGLADGRPWTTVWIWIAPLLMVLAYTLAFQRRWKPGALGCDGRSLTLTQRGETQSFELEDIVGGTVMTDEFDLARTRVPDLEQTSGTGESAQLALLRFEMRDGSWIEAWTQDALHAAKLLALAGVNADQHRFTLQSRATWRRIFSGVAGFFLGAFPAGALAVLLDRTMPTLSIPVALGGMVLTMVVMVALGTPPRVTVGRDGIEIARPLKREFYPFSKIRTIDDVRDGARIELVSGRDVLLNDAWLAVDAVRRRALTDRMRAAHAASQERNAPAHAALLDRNGESMDHWRKRLADLVRVTESYRSASLNHEQLTRVLEDVSMPIERRVAAAMALRSANEATASEQIRIAARTTADQRVRVAFERIAEGADADDEVEAVLRDEQRSHHAGART